jgi:putative ABC transport system permease protein
MNASAIDESYTQQAIAEITEILRRNHKLKASDSDDFEIMSMDEILSTMDSVMSMLTLLLGSVAGISLIVGGIGIMNIMYVSVTERTKELGLRMSIGAIGRDILAQFLIEAIMISITGGIIGVIIGAILAYLAGMLVGFSATIQPWTVGLAFSVCTFTGVFFGWYPAKKAAQLDPIEAIRYE